MEICKIIATKAAELQIYNSWLGFYSPQLFSFQLFFSSLFSFSHISPAANQSMWSDLKSGGFVGAAVDRVVLDRVKEDDERGVRARGAFPLSIFGEEEGEEVVENKEERGSGGGFGFGGGEIGAFTWGWYKMVMGGPRPALVGVLMGSVAAVHPLSAPIC